MKKIFIVLLLIFSNSIFAGISTHLEYHGPTEQLIKRESWEKIEKKLKSWKIPPELFPFFNEIAAQEDWGHIGYHGTNQQFRIFQDIIRFTVEEILAIPIREDFHFLRIPGDMDLNLKNREEFIAYWGKKTDNRKELRAKQLLSLNFGIYSNFDLWGSCSLNFFVHDFSISKKDYVKLLTPFYKQLEISPSALYCLFDIAKKWLDGDQGILLQFSENSHLKDPNHEAFNFADEFCYPAKRGGGLYGIGTISNQYEEIFSDEYVNQEMDIAPQLRLILSNRVTLNPYSNLIVRRWDLHDEETIANYEAEMRNYIRNLKYDEVSVQYFKSNLLKTWLN